jgi:hypothetical protein
MSVPLIFIFLCYQLWNFLLIILFIWLLLSIFVYLFLKYNLFLVSLIFFYHPSSLYFISNSQFPSFCWLWSYFLLCPVPGGWKLVWLFAIVLFFSFFPVLWFELRASRLLDRWSTTWATPPALFCDFFVYLFFSTQGLSNYFPGLASNRDPPDLCLLNS